MMIEQAVFTSAQTERAVGYQVAARSAGVDEVDAKDLAVWCPSHDSLLDCGPQASSVNFHPLSSGAYCVSRTIAAGWEYSGRGGHRVYTHCLIVSPQTLWQFANNPFSLLRAAMAHGAMAVHGEVPPYLEGFALPGSASAVDCDLLSRLATNPGPLRMALLVQTALENKRVAVFGPPNAEKLIAGLINCLPPECRTEFSFSTGLKYSSRRPFRLVGASGDPAQMRWLSHQPNVVVLDLSQPPTCPEAALEGWARLIYRLLSARRITLLASQLSKPRPELTSADLPALALQLLEDFEAHTLRAAFQPVPAAIASTAAPSPLPVTPPSDQRPEEAGRLLADAAHHFPACGEAAEADAAVAPAHRSAGETGDHANQRLTDDQPVTADQRVTVVKPETGGKREGADEPDRRETDDKPVSDDKAVSHDKPVCQHKPISDDKRARDDKRPSRACGTKAAHAAHRKFAKTSQAEGSGSPADLPARKPRPSTASADKCAAVLEQLEHLDDVVFNAIAGSPAAMEELRTLWPRLLADLGEELLAESRQQYLRWGLSNLESTLDPDVDYDPDRALQVVEVMCLLFDNL